MLNKRYYCCWCEWKAHEAMKKKTKHEAMKSYYFIINNVKVILSSIFIVEVNYWSYLIENCLIYNDDLYLYAYKRN